MRPRDVEPRRNRAEPRNRPPGIRRHHAVFGRTGESHALARAFVHDIVTRLAKLRSMRVIASGSVFALSGRGSTIAMLPTCFVSITA
jgi:hypothetical protein